jgi:hypothetical protein
LKLATWDKIVEEPKIRVEAAGAARAAAGPARVDMATLQLDDASATHSELVERAFLVGARSRSPQPR